MLLAPIGLWAQSDVGPPVEVRNVRFGFVRPVGGSDNWMEATVELTVRGTPTGNPRFVDQVRVALGIGLQSTMAEETGFVFYRSEAEASTLESGTARFRFYLPAAVVKRYQLGRQPFAFAVDVWVGGRAIPDTRTAVSTNLHDAGALRSFRDRVAQDAVRNDGILVPQFKTPFIIEYAQDTPPFVLRSR
jgi:hypothetical protein